jgi:hypothetical protein
MSRWITITPDHLKAAGHGALMDRAQTLAVGGLDPIPEAIDDATMRIRLAVSTGNVLDIDPTKIPASLKGMACRLCLYALQERIGMLTPSQRAEAERPIQSDLNRISDEKKKVDLADNPESTASVAPTGMKAQAVNVPRRQTGRWRTSGL